MSNKIENYAMIGNGRTAALVGVDGSIDWLCLPSFSDGACFAGLLGSAENGRWLLCPIGDYRPTRRYRGDTMILETEYTTSDGSVAVVTDFMPYPNNPAVERPGVDLVRTIRCIKGSVRFHSEAVVRFDYGRSIPRARSLDQTTVTAFAGPDAVVLRAPSPQQADDKMVTADITVTAGGPAATFSMTWFKSYQLPPPPVDVEAMEQETERFWREWSSRCRADHPYRDAVVRSMLTLKAMVFEPSGGIVAAPTTSLPESLGGIRNWDYRYSWIRDATLTLYSLISTGYTQEGEAWRQWLLRAVAGQPDQLQILYGIRGERRLPEYEATWLEGYGGSKPVHIGNAAHAQFQLDVYGEFMAAMHLSRTHSQKSDDDEAWHVQKQVMDYVEQHWQKPDKSIWEVRGPKREFTQSTVMAWMAVDRCIKAVEQFGLDGPVDRWRKLREEIHADVCKKGFNKKMNAFTQYYGGDTMDAALLMLPQTGFIKATDPRFVGTVAAIEKHLLDDRGFVLRYIPEPSVEGFDNGEGAFLPCGFWLVTAYHLMGRKEEAHQLFDKLLAIRNDVGLLSEEYDSKHGLLLGNFPQAFTHVGLVATANLLAGHHGANDPMGADAASEQGEA